MNKLLPALLFSALTLTIGTLTPAQAQSWPETLGAAPKPQEGIQQTNRPLIGLYFTASWCRPCRQFTPRLIEAFKSQKDLALVTVCLDQTPQAQQTYTEKMPWPTLAFDNPNREKLTQKYQVLQKGIPRILIFSQNGEGPLSEDGTNFVDNPAILAHWLKQVEQSPHK
jgi:thiol-disulfide isomerase/thioredoxin